jgi:molecular chaperone DnaJ
VSKDPYKILGVEKDASKSEIKKAYRKLALKHHPDKNPNDSSAEDCFKDAAEAYNTLSDDDRRRAYDMHADGSRSSEGFSHAGFGDIFSDFFGGNFNPFGDRSKQSRPSNQGEDIRIEYTIGFLEAIKGTEENIRIKRKSLCQGCHGTGFKSGIGTSRCVSCSGTGKINTRRGNMVFTSTCGSCSGRGNIHKKCIECSGKRRIGKDNTISVKFPPGIDTGNTLRLSNQGHQDTAGTGDLYLNIKVAPHKEFTREGINIHNTLEIPITAAVLGGSVHCNTVDGVKVVEIPPGTQNNDTLKLHGLGVISLKAHTHGDHLAEIIVKVPQDLSPEQIESFILLKQTGI